MKHCAYTPDITLIVRYATQLWRPTMIDNSCRICESFLIISEANILSTWTLTSRRQLSRDGGRVGRSPTTTYCRQC